MAQVNLDGIKNAFAKLKRRPSDVVGLDVAYSGTKAVRIRKGDGQFDLVAADILPPIQLPRKPGDDVAAVLPLTLPKPLMGRHVSFAVPGEYAVVKLLAFPGQTPPEEVESKIVEGIGVESMEQYRIGYKIVNAGHGKGETRALAVAEPDVEAGGACRLFPIGVPVPYSVEISGLASLTTFMHGPLAAHKEDTVGIIEFGARVSFFAILNKGIPVLLRKFELGSNMILEKVQESLGIDRSTAEGILSDGSFDISQQMSEVMDSFVKQVVVSRDFVERRENCHVSKIFASGGITASRDWLMEMKSALGYEVDLFNPFEGLRVAAEAYPDRLKGQEGRFAAAVGACMATLAPEEQA